MPEILHFQNACGDCVVNLFYEVHMIIKHISNSFTDKCKVFYFSLKAAQPKGPGAGAPSGGVPLSMREVEELERMTKDFIKDMDNRAPVITSAPTGGLSLLQASI